MLPYPTYKVYAGGDAFFDFEFVDHTLTPVIPTLFQWQLDDLTNSLGVIALTTTVVSAAAYTLQIPGAQLVQTYPYQGSSLLQLSTTFTALDSVTGTSFTAKGVVILELIPIQTPNGL